MVEPQLTAEIGTSLNDDSPDVGQNYKALIEIGYDLIHASEIALSLGRSSGITIFGGQCGSGKWTTMNRSVECLIKQRPGIKLHISEHELEDGIAGQSFPSIVDEYDFMVIGGIRDRAAAELGLQEARAGHRVAAAIQAVSWADILNNLSSMGLDYKDLAQTGILSGLIYQQLVPELCPKCRVPFSKMKETEENVEFMQRVSESWSERIVAGLMVRGCGCRHCGNRGVINPTACVETAVMTDEILGHIGNGDIDGAISEWRSHRNNHDMTGRWAVEHALHKMKLGRISPDFIESSFGYMTEINNIYSLDEGWASKESISPADRL